MLELIVVRHGESIRNYASKIAHQGDLSLLQAQLSEEDYEPGWPLTDLGRSQASSTGGWIKAESVFKPDLVLVSPYRRTLQTAHWMDLGVDPEQDWRLRERRWGDFSQCEEPYTAEKYLADLRHAGEPDYRPPFPGSESVNDLIPHVRDFVTSRLSQLDGHHVVIVTHGGAMKALQAVLEGTADDPHKTSVPNCSAIWFKIKTIRPDGSAEGDVELLTPWQPDGGTEHWQHFG